MGGGASKEEMVAVRMGWGQLVVGIHGLGSAKREGRQKRVGGERRGHQRLS